MYGERTGLEITLWQNRTCMDLVGKNDGSVVLNGGHVDFFFMQGFFLLDYFGPSNPLIPKLRFLMVECVTV